MGTRIYTEVYDDIDETVGDDVQTVAFGYRGKDYEIDLNAKNRKKLERALNVFIESARIPVTDKSKKPKSAEGTKRKYSRSYPTTLIDGRSTETVARQWAIENGIEVNRNGRVRQPVVVKFMEAFPELVPSANLNVQHDG